MDLADRKAKLDNLLLALGPDTYAYALRPPYSDGDAVATLPIAVPDGQCLHWVALGPVIDSYYFCFKDRKEGTFHCQWGEEIPKKLRSWLSNIKRTRPGDRQTRQQHTKVVLGPGQSFLAWDQESIRWGDIPDVLEETLQSWFTPKGWKHGPLVHATLGCDGSFYLVTSKGAAAFLIPPNMKTLSQMSQSWPSKGSNHLSQQRICLSPCRSDQFIVVERSRIITANCPAMNGLSFIADHLYTPEEREIRRQARQEARWPRPGGKEHPEPEFSSDTPENSADGQQDFHNPPPPPPPPEENETPGRDGSGPYFSFDGGWTDNERKHDRQDGAAASFDTAEIPLPKRAKLPDLVGAVQVWRAYCSELFSSSKPIVFFPMLPTMNCRCDEPVCVSLKTSSALKACAHEVADVFKACDGYSAAWLKKERLRWHPDAFGRRCAPNKRDVLCRAASELFAMLGNLMEECSSSGKSKSTYS